MLAALKQNLGNKKSFIYRGFSDFFASQPYFSLFWAAKKSIRPEISR